MNRGAAISILFILFVLISTMGMMNTYHIKTEMTKYLLSAEQAAACGDTEQAAKISETIEKKWNEKEKWLLLYVRHDEVDTINQSIAELKSLIRYQDMGGFCAKINQTIAMIEHIWESELPVFQNIL